MKKSILVLMFVNLLGLLYAQAYCLNINNQTSEYQNLNKEKLQILLRDVGFATELCGLKTARNVKYGISIELEDNSLGGIAIELDISSHLRNMHLLTTSSYSYFDMDFVVRGIYAIENWINAVDDNVKTFYSIYREKDNIEYYEKIGMNFYLENDDHEIRIWSTLDPDSPSITIENSFFEYEGKYYSKLLSDVSDIETIFTLRNIPEDKIIKLDSTLASLSTENINPLYIDSSIEKQENNELYWYQKIEEESIRNKERQINQILSNNVYLISYLESAGFYYLKMEIHKMSEDEIRLMYQGYDGRLVFYFTWKPEIEIYNNQEYINKYSIDVEMNGNVIGQALFNPNRKEGYEKLTRMDGRNEKENIVKVYLSGRENLMFFEIGEE
jgi:hypothetical protein